MMQEVIEILHNFDEVKEDDDYSASDIVYVSDDVIARICDSKDKTLGTAVWRELLSQDSGDVTVRPILKGEGAVTKYSYRYTI